MLSPGDRIDRYEVLSVLGQGGMAVVYRARHAELGSEHAIKLLTAVKPQLQERLLTEGRIQARLSHPNLVRVHDVLRVDGRPALVMEYVEGPSLDAYVERVRPDLAAIERLFRGVCAGVAHAHAHGMIHRDLKPGNVLVHVVDGVPIPKVTDFGIAKVLVDEGTSGSTSAGIAMGTPRYMAPEQIRDASSVDARADVYALGSMLYELLAGEPLVDSIDLVGIYERAMKDDHPSPGEHVPLRLRGALRHALRGARRERIPDAATLLRVLDTGEFTADPTSDTLVPRPADATVDLGAVLGRTPPPAPGRDATPPTWSEANVLGAWRLIDRIDVHKGVERWHVESAGKKGLLKALRADVSPSAASESRKRIELQKREGRVLRQIVHPRVPALLDEFVDGEGSERRLVLVREDPGGQPLTAHLAGHRYERDEVIARAAELCDVLAALHRLSPPVIHREITADHVWVAPDGAWHVADLGAVRDDAPSQDLGGGTFVGRWGYMAPEQFAGDAGPTTDSYGVAALIVHVLTRKAPSELLDRDGRIVLRPHLSDPLAGLLERMLDADPAARPTAAEAAAALRSLLPKPKSTAKKPSAAVLAALQTDPAVAEQAREPVSDPLPKPIALAPPPPLVIPPPPIPVDPSTLLKVAVAGVLAALVLIAVPVAVYFASPGPVPVVYTPPPPVEYDPVLTGALQGALSSPSLEKCARAWRERNPKSLSQRVDVEFLVEPNDAGTAIRKATASFGGFVDDPLRACLVDAGLETHFTGVPAALKGPTHLKGHVDLDALAPIGSVPPP